MKTIQTAALLITLALISLTLPSCSKDGCENATCLNGGECIDGSCNCPENFTGKFCAEQNTPDRIWVRSIQLIRFPGMNADASWDEGDGPDVYFRLYEGEHP
ncbi:MAG TPA: calcium-binding EGF-like domain-containing protein, partial [Saprospiraceae bacterium]|nr:calcium-binding EGF-like domain-containing protein [Saprospiraceae bacterium]